MKLFIILNDSGRHVASICTFALNPANIRGGPKQTWVFWAVNILRWAVYLWESKQAHFPYPPPLKCLLSRIGQPSTSSVLWWLTRGGSHKDSRYWWPLRRDSFQWVRGMFIAIDNLGLEARPSRSRSFRNGQAAGLDTWGSPCQTSV